MISEFFYTIATQLVTFLTGLFGTIEFPTWFVNLPGPLNQAVAKLDGLGAWADFAIISACVAFNLLAWGFFFGLKLLRVGVSHSPVSGGSG